MEITVNTPNLGKINVRDIMIDSTCSILEEGVEISSNEIPKKFDTIELIGFSTEDELFENPTYLENFILEY